MTHATRQDPYKNFKFRLEIDGIVRAGFHEALGLDVEHTSGDQQSQHDSELRPLAGLRKYTNITLKRGFTADRSLWQWHQETANKTQRRNGSIVLMDEADREQIRWNFIKGWPIKLTGPGFNASANDVTIEVLEITHEGLTRV